jgi:hypothetical protein
VCHDGAGVEVDQVVMARRCGDVWHPLPVMDDIRRQSVHHLLDPQTRAGGRWAPGHGRRWTAAWAEVTKAVVVQGQPPRCPYWTIAGRAVEPDGAVTTNRTWPEGGCRMNDQTGGTARAGGWWRASC